MKYNTLACLLLSMVTISTMFFESFDWLHTTLLAWVTLLYVVLSYVMVGRR